MKNLNISSRVKATTANAPQNSAAFAQLQTVEGCEAFLANLSEQNNALQDADLSVRMLLSLKMKHADLACAKLRLKAERDRVAQVIEDDMASAREAIQTANGEQAATLAAHLAAVADVQALQGRLAPMVEQLEAMNADQIQRIEAATIAFQNAVDTNAGEAAEVATAEALIQAAQAQAQSDGALTLRINALNAQLSSLQALAAQAEQAHKEACERTAGAVAWLGLVEYSKSANALVEAFWASRHAVKALKQLPSGVAGVNVPTLQLPTVRHAIFGHQMDGHSNCTYSLRSLSDWSSVVHGEVDWALLDMPLPVMQEASTETVADDADDTEGTNSAPDGRVAFGETDTILQYPAY